MVIKLVYFFINVLISPCLRAFVGFIAHFSDVWSFFGNRENNFTTFAHYLRHLKAVQTSGLRGGPGNEDTGNNFVYGHTE